MDEIERISACKTIIYLLMGKQVSDERRSAAAGLLPEEAWVDTLLLNEVADHEQAMEKAKRAIAIIVWAGKLKAGKVPLTPKNVQLIGEKLAAAGCGGDLEACEIMALETMLAEPPSKEPTLPADALDDEDDDEDESGEDEDGGDDAGDDADEDGSDEGDADDADASTADTSTPLTQAPIVTGLGRRPSSRHDNGDEKERDRVKDVKQDADKPANGPAYRICGDLTVPPPVPGDPFSFHDGELCLNERWKHLRSMIVAAVELFQSTVEGEREVGRKALIDLPANLDKPEWSAYYGPRVSEAGRKMLKHVSSCLDLNPAQPAAAAPVI